MQNIFKYLFKRYRIEVPCSRRGFIAQSVEHRCCCLFVVVVVCLFVCLLFVVVVCLLLGGRGVREQMNNFF